MKPNILWICTDQQRFDGLSCYGNEVLDTPNIDEIADRGILFERVYCQSPVCTPSRASFLTGRYPRTCRTRQNGQQIPQDEVLITKLLSQEGYTLGLSGKLHISPCHTSVCSDMEKRTDDGYSIFQWSHHPDFEGADSNWPLNGYNQWLRSKGQSYRRDSFQGSNYVYTGLESHLSHSRWCADQAIDFIGSFQRYKGNPWAFSLNFYDPHHDFDPPEELLQKYLKRLNSDHLPQYREKELEEKTLYQRQDHIGAYGNPGFYSWEDMEEGDHLMIKAAYYAMIEQIDHEVGRIIDALKKSGQYENTLIIFMSDHGEMLGDHGIYLKGPYFYEPLVKVPLIVSWPKKLAQGQRVDELIELVDLAPTIMEIIGIKSSPYMQGTSFYSFLIDSDYKEAIRDSVYSSFDNAMARDGDKAYVSMVATKEYKLVYCHSTKEGELYDLIKDSQESYNLYRSKDYEYVKTMMMELMINRIAFTLDPKPERVAYY